MGVLIGAPHRLHTAESSEAISKRWGGMRGEGVGRGAAVSGTTRRQGGGEAQQLKHRAVEEKKGESARE